MKINCFRCGKVIDTPNPRNADYVMADDMIVDELRDVYTIVKHNEDTLAIKAKMEETETYFDEEDTLEEKTRLVYPNLKLYDSDYTRLKVSRYEDVGLSLDIIRVELTKEMTPIQKTGIICPDCYLDTDFIIWGVHKETE